MTTTSGAFWDGIAANYAAKPVEDVPSYEAKLERIRGLVHADDRVLEVGCGSGSTALAIAPHVHEYVGTDISKEMVRIATEKRAADTANLRFEQHPAHERAAGAPFDAVFAFSLLHLVDDVDETLAAVHDQLKPSGLFVSKTVCLGERSGFIRAMVRVMRWVGKAPLVRSLTHAELVAAIESAGFEIEEVSHFGMQKTNPFVIARRRS